MHTRSVTLWLLGGGALAILAAAACGAADEQQSQTQQVAPTGRTLRHTLEAIAVVPPQYVLVPGGIVLHQDCVHEVPDGAEVDADFNVRVRGVTVASYSRCSHKAYQLVGRSEPAEQHPPALPPGGWVENSLASSTQTMFTHMDSGTWQVPSAPTRDDGQTIYMFPSVTGGGWIVQPVLQWQAGSWGVNNWVVMGSDVIHAFKGTLASVSVGDQLSGVMNIVFRTSTSQTWTVGWTNLTRGTSASDTFTFADANPLKTAEGAVLEAYNIANCSDFPATGFTQFGAPTMYQGNDYNGRSRISPMWFASNYINNFWDGPVCSQFGINVLSDGTTQLYY